MKQTAPDAKAFRVERLGAVASTNDEAMARARAGDPGGLWIVADEQTGGRGRQGRAWASPPGNLYASLLLIDPAPPGRAPELGFVAGVALCEALRDVLGGDERLAVKWPNDMLFDGAKLSGMLLEGALLPDGRFACVIGIGVNCASHPATTPYRATHLAEIGTTLAEPREVFVRLSAALAHWLAIWDKGAGFAAVRARWLRSAANLGRDIAVATPTQRLEGRFETIDAQGRLVLQTSSGRVTVEAGDVFLAAPARLAPA